MAPSTFTVSGFRRGTLRSQLVSFSTASGWRVTEVVSATIRKDYMMTLVRVRPPFNSLLAPWCHVMPQGDVITVDNWVPAAKSKPLIKLADSAMRFTPEESETPSAFTVAERNVCVIESDDSDGSGRDGPNGREAQPNFVAALTLGSKARVGRRSATMEPEAAYSKYWVRRLPKQARLRRTLSQPGRLWWQI